MTNDTLTPVDANQHLFPPISPQLSSSAYLTTPPSSPRSVEQIWDEGVDRVRRRERYRNQRLSPAAIDERLDRCSEATLLDVIAVYQNRVSSTLPSRKVTSPYKGRMSHSPLLLGDAVMDEKKRSDSAVSIDNQDADRPTSAKISRCLYPYPQEMTLQPKASVSPPRRAQFPTSPHHLSPQRPILKRTQSSIPEESRRPSLTSANSFPAPSGVFGVHDRLPRTSSRVNILAQPIDKNASNQTSPFPSLNLSISTQSNLPPHLLPSAMFHNQDSFHSTPFSSTTTTPLPSPQEVYFFPTPPGSSCGNAPLMFPSRPTSSHTSPLSQLQPTLRSAFDDDDDDDVDPSVMEKMKKSLQLRRAPRSRNGSMPESSSAEEREKELQKILGYKQKTKRERSKTSWSASCCSCFGAGD